LFDEVLNVDGLVNFNETSGYCICTIDIECYVSVRAVQFWKTRSPHRRETVHQLHMTT